MNKPVLSIPNHETVFFNRSPKQISLSIEMGLGVLEGERYSVFEIMKGGSLFWSYTHTIVVDRSNLQNVPGTFLLNDTAAHAEEAVQALKHSTGKDARIVLSPQPSEDPNDPLNWPMWRKELIIGILSLGALLNAGTNVSGQVLSHQRGVGV